MTRDEQLAHLRLRREESYLEGKMAAYEAFDTAIFEIVTQRDAYQMRPSPDPIRPTQRPVRARRDGTGQG